MGYTEYKFGEVINTSPNDANAINYDNSISELESTTMQTAIDELNERIIAGGITYTLTKENNKIILNGSDSSKTEVTDSNTTYSFSQSGTTLTITPSTGDPVTITLGEEITSEKIVTALGFTPAKQSEIPNVPDWALASNKPSYTATEVGALANTTTHLSGDIATTEKGANNGVATLGDDGKIPSSQLPSYVDDVLEYNKKADFPATGESGKIYIDTSTNITYRWSGTVYVAIGSDLALGETSSTAYAGDKGKAVTDNLATHTANTTVHITTAERTSWNAKGSYSKPSAGIPKTDLASDVQTSLGKADTALQEHQDISGKADKTELPTTLAELTDDATHRLVTDTEKSTWNGNKITEVTQAQYNALTDAQKNSGNYFITDASESADADMIGYDNSTSGLTSNNVQGVIDELNDTTTKIVYKSSTSRSLSMNANTFYELTSVDASQKCLLRITISGSFTTVNANTLSIASLGYFRVNCPTSGIYSFTTLSKPVPANAHIPIGFYVYGCTGTAEVYSILVEEIPVE